MKWFAAMLLFSLPWVSFAQKGKTNAADFPLTIHVLYSRAVPLSPISFPYGSYQQFETVIGGQHLELMYPSAGVLALGDYPARPFTHPLSSHPNSYDLYQGYELLMPDGKVRGYWVVGIGPADGNPAAKP
jgi:hypothetical protein